MTSGPRTYTSAERRLRSLRFRNERVDRIRFAAQERHFAAVAANELRDEYRWRNGPKSARFDSLTFAQAQVFTLSTGIYHNETVEYEIVWNGTIDRSGEVDVSPIGAAILPHNTETFTPLAAKLKRIRHGQHRAWWKRPGAATPRPDRTPIQPLPFYLRWRTRHDETPPLRWHDVIGVGETAGPQSMPQSGRQRSR